MPTALIEVRCQYNQEKEQALIDAVHRAMVESLKIPEDDRTVRLIVHASHRFACPPAKSCVDLYALIGTFTKPKETRSNPLFLLT